MSNIYTPQVDQFFRTYKQPFDVKSMVKILASMGVRCSQKEAASLLVNNPLVFALEDNLYITRAGAFTNEIFSINPTAKEYREGVIVIGDRVLPFVDNDVISCTLQFYIDGHEIPKKTGTFDCDFAIDRFMLYGEEYAPQYILNDPANAGYDYAANGMLLPSNVKLTGLDMEFLAENFGWRKDDRLLCSIGNWDEGVINVMVLPGAGSIFEPGEIGEQHFEWYEHLEKELLSSFERFGPCESIENQLANVFFENRAELCHTGCGSLSEYLDSYMKEVSFEYYGVETRLWFKGKQVPAIGPWNRMFEASQGVKSRVKNQPYPQFILPDVVYQLYVEEMVRKNKDNIEDQFNSIFPRDCYIDPEYRQATLLKMQTMFDIMRDSRVSRLREDPAAGIKKYIIDLFVKVSYLIFQLGSVGNELEDFPQSELVTLSQLFANLVKIVQSVAVGAYSKEECDSLEMSIEGMEWNFEEIAPAIRNALERYERSKFKVSNPLSSKNQNKK